MDTEGRQKQRELILYADVMDAVSVMTHSRPQRRCEAGVKLKYRYIACLRVRVYSVPSR